MNDLFKIKYCCISIKMITCFVLITLCLRSSVFYAEAACKYCTTLQNFTGPFPHSQLGSSWLISENRLLNHIQYIVSDTRQIPKYKELKTRPIPFSIKTDLCGDNITFNMVLEDIWIYVKTFPKGYRTKGYQIISWQDSTQKIIISDSGDLVTP